MQTKIIVKKVPHPYPVEKVKIKTIIKKMPYPVPKPYAVVKTKTIYKTKKVPKPVPYKVEVPKPYPVIKKVFVPKPYPVVKKIKVPVIVEHKVVHKKKKKKHYGHEGMSSNNQYKSSFPETDIGEDSSQGESKENYPQSNLHTDWHSSPPSQDSRSASRYKHHSQPSEEGDGEEDDYTTSRPSYHREYHHGPRGEKHEYRNNPHQEEDQKSSYATEESEGNYDENDYKQESEGAISQTRHELIPPPPSSSYFDDGNQQSSSFADSYEESPPSLSQSSISVSSSSSTPSTPPQKAQVTFYSWSSTHPVKEERNRNTKDKKHNHH